MEGGQSNFLVLQFGLEIRNFATEGFQFLRSCALLVVVCFHLRRGLRQFLSYSAQLGMELVALGLRGSAVFSGKPQFFLPLLEKSFLLSHLGLELGHFAEDLLNLLLRIAALLLNAGQPLFEIAFLIGEPIDETLQTFALNIGKFAGPHLVVLLLELFLDAIVFHLHFNKVRGGTVEHLSERVNLTEEGFDLEIGIIGTSGTSTARRFAGQIINSSLLELLYHLLLLQLAFQGFDDIVLSVQLRFQCRYTSLGSESTSLHNCKHDIISVASGRSGRRCGRQRRASSRSTLIGDSIQLCAQPGHFGTQSRNRSAGSCKLVSHRRILDLLGSLGKGQRANALRGVGDGRTDGSHETRL